VDRAVDALRPIDFYHPLYRQVFEIIMDLRLVHELPVSYLTVSKYAREYKGKKIAVTQLVDLESALPVAMWGEPETAEPYFRILHEAGDARLKASAVQEFSQGKLSA